MLPLSLPPNRKDHLHRTGPLCVMQDSHHTTSHPVTGQQWSLLWNVALTEGNIQGSSSCQEL